MHFILYYKMRKLYYYPIKLKHLKSCCEASRNKSFNFSTFLPSKNIINPTLSNRKTRFIRREFAILLQSPASKNPILYYKTIHGQIIVSGVQYDTFLSNILLHTYSKCDSLNVAQLLFDEMPQRNLISWSSMLSSFTQHGFNEEALMLFIEFRRSCEENANEFVFASVIRACMQLGGVDEGAQVHDLVVKCGFDQYVYVGTALLDFYSKNVGIEDARLVFDGLCEKTTVTWTTMIMGYTKCGRGEVSLQLFNQMRETNVVLDGYVISSILSACLLLEFFEGGKQIHAYGLKRGMETNISVANVLMDVYVKCGRVKTGRILFDQMVVKNVISWTTMISGYMQNSFERAAMKLFAEMTRSGWKPDGFTCTSVLTSCGSLQGLEQGKQVHAYTIKANLESDEFVKIGLVDMYAKCDSLADARRAFDVLGNYSIISYNAMIEGYSRLEELSEALDLFHEMRLKSFPPNLLTFISLLGVFASLSTLELSKQIHGLIIKFGVSLDIFAGSALIGVYSKCSSVKDGRLVFEQMNEKDIVVWNAMLFGYTQQLENEEALKLYQELQLSRQKPNDFTFAALINAASNLVSLPQGQQFHNQLIKMGLDFSPFISNALVDMYAKCGCIKEAQKMFSSSFWRDVACWNSMISTYAHHGEAKKALQMFETMVKDGIKPNYVTFVGVLSACSHVGLVEDGLRYFNSMPRFKVEPGTEHYASMVSLLGRAGKLHEAKEFIEKMPSKPAAIIWRSLLSACQNAGNVELGKYAAEMAISIDPNDSGSYILLSNIFASKGLWFDVKKVRERMDFNGVVKEPGCSWIEVNNEVHVFITRDIAHNEANLICSVLENLIHQSKWVGYVPETTTLMLND